MRCDSVATWLAVLTASLTSFSPGALTPALGGAAAFVGGGEPKRISGGASSLIPVINHPDETVRLEAVTKLQGIGVGDAATRRALIGVLWDGNWYVRHRAALALGQLGLRSEDIPALVSAWQWKGRDSNDWDLVSLMVAIDPSLARNHQQIPHLFLEGLQSPDAEIRKNSVIALGGLRRALGDKASASWISALRQHQSDQNAVVRAHVAMAMGLSEWQSPPREDLLQARKYRLLAMENDRSARYSFYPECGNPKRSSLMITEGSGVGELLSAMQNPETRFIATYTLIYTLTPETSFFYITAFPEIHKDQLGQIIREQRRVAIASLMDMSRTSTNLDLRRAALYALMALAPQTEMPIRRRVEEDLNAIVQNDLEEANLRWMAALGLQALGRDMTSFFQYLAIPGPSSWPSIPLDFKEWVRGSPSLDFDIYSGQYIYNRRAPCGGGLTEIFNALRRLMP